jgi:serine/threonine protein kinase
MGVVMLAHDTALDIPVAVKLVPDLVAKDVEAIADLRREVLRGMALNHDGIVRTHNFEKDDSGAGIVMEYVEGETLLDVKRRQPGGCFDVAQILPWLEQLCAILDYAHLERRIVHLDLKPRNIMLTQAGKVKVADFGFAALISDSMSRHSTEGVLSGTLGYMSPQQAEGRRPSHLDDIHALGATVYELLTGKPPFFRGGQAAIYQQIIGVVPPSVSERRVELEVAGKAPLALAIERAIADCLAKDPVARPASAGEFLRKARQAETRVGPPPLPSPNLSAPSPRADFPAGSASGSNPWRVGWVQWSGTVFAACIWILFGGMSIAALPPIFAGQFDVGILFPAFLVPCLVWDWFRRDWGSRKRLLAAIGAVAVISFVVAMCVS